MELLKVGFTGTQVGMTSPQQEELKRHLLRWKATYDRVELHHGDCIGADEECHRLFLEILGSKLQVVLHPPTNTSKRAYCTSPGQKDLEPLPYLERNHAIVDAADGMLAAPKSPEEELRSGTWATVRYTRKNSKPLIMLLGDMR